MYKLLHTYKGMPI